MQLQSVREQFLERVRRVPFRTFAIVLDSGDRIVVEHPENIAFSPDEDGRTDFYYITRGVSGWSTFDKVTQIAFLDEGKPTGK